MSSTSHAPYVPTARSPLEPIRPQVLQFLYPRCSRPATRVQGWRRWPFSKAYSVSPPQQQCFLQVPPTQMLPADTSHLPDLHKHALRMCGQFSHPRRQTLRVGGVPARTRCYVCRVPSKHRFARSVGVALTMKQLNQGSAATLASMCRRAQAHSLNDAEVPEGRTSGGARCVGFEAGNQTAGTFEFR